MLVQHPTFLMLDVKGSTKVTQALSRQDYLRRVHEPVYAKLQALFAHYEGTMSGTPHGDDALVVFADVNKAIACAVAIQAELPDVVTHDAEQKVRDLQVRIAVHRAVKETSPHTDGSYPNDLEVIYVARMLSCVEGGQILVSAETFDRADNQRWQWEHWPNRRLEKWDETPQTLYELLYAGWTSVEPGARFRPDWFRETNQYIPRPALEQRIADLFARKTVNGTPYRLVTLHDFGGMGKTRLAVQVCLDSAGLFGGRLRFVRLDGISEDLLKADESRRNYLAGQIAAEFEIEGEDAAPDKLPAKLKQDKKIDKPTLLLLDNYETVKGKSAARLVSDILYHCPLLTLLVTGREPVGLHNVELECNAIAFEEKEAYRLFVTRVKEQPERTNWQPDVTEHTAIVSIVKDTARIPLAVELVAAHVRHTPIPTIAAELHRELYGERTELPEGMYSDDPTGRHETLEKCYDWSWKLLKESARQALVRLSLFADDALETEIRDCFPEIEDKALVQLQNAALLLRSEEDHKSRYTLLNPTRQYGHKRLKATDTEQAIQRHYVTHFRRVVEENGGRDKQEIPVHLERLKAAWRHAVRAAEHAAEIKDAEASGAIADGLAQFVERQAIQRDVLPLYELDLTVRRQSLSPGHPDIATSLNNLAVLYHSQGRYEEAEPLYNEALVIWRESLPLGHPNIATSLNNLAGLYHAQGRYEEAEPLLHEALALRRQSLSPGHSDIATSLNNLAAFYDSQGRYGEAEPLELEALEIRRQSLPLGHPDIVTSLNNLAESYHVQGRYEEAEPLYDEALAIRRQSLPPGHVDIAYSLNNLAMFYKAQGRYEEAEPLYKEALVVWRQSLPPGHPNIASSLNNMAMLYFAQSRYEEAEPLYNEALAVWRQSLPPGHPNIATSLNNLAEFYSVQGRYAEAEPLYNEALVVWRESLPLGHPNIASGLNNLAGLYCNQGRYREAEPLLKEALEIHRQFLPLGHPKTAISLNNLAMFYKAQDHYEEAEPLCKEALAILERVLGTEHPNTKDVRENLEQLLQERQK